MNFENEYKVSVIIPVYNSEIYLEQCLNSVINQTLKEKEIICINDGSTDNSAQILERFKSFSNIKVFNTKNSGASFARNMGIRKAKGEYISFVDSDDTIPQDYLSELYNTAMEDNYDIVMTGFNFVSNNSIFHCADYKEGIYETFYEKCSQIINGATWDKLFKASLIKENNIKFLEGRMWEDNLFVIQALYYSNKMKIINSPKYNYKINPNSVTNNRNLADKRNEDAQYIYKITMDFVKNINLSPFEISVVDSFLKNRALPGYIKNDI